MARDVRQLALDLERVAQLLGLRRARDAADRPGRCRRRDRSPPSVSSRAGRLLRGLGQRVRRRLAASTPARRPVTEPLAQLVEPRGVITSSISRRRFCRSSMTALRTRAMRAGRSAACASSSASNSNVTSSSRTGPSARVMRRTRFCARSSACFIGPRAQHRQRLAQPARRDAGLVHRHSSPACAAGMARQQRDEALAQERDREGRMLHARMSLAIIAPSRLACDSRQSTSAPTPST